MSKFLLRLDTKKNEKERIPSLLANLQRKGKIKLSQVALLETADEHAEAVRAVLGLLEIEMEEIPEILETAATLTWSDPNISVGYGILRIEPKEDITTETTEKEKKTVSIETPSSALPICPHCHEPFKPSRKDQKSCMKDFCKSEQKRIYMAAYIAKKKAAASPTVEVSAEPADPFSGHDPNAHWLNLETGEMFSEIVLPGMLEGWDLKPGTMLQRRGGGTWEVYEDETGLRVREVVPATELGTTEATIP